MDIRIGDISHHHLDPPGRLSGSEKPGAVETAKSFTEFLSEVVSGIDKANKAAEALGVEFALGGAVEVHDVMLAFSKADISLRLFLELRNKVIEAYQEIMRMPV